MLVLFLLMTFTCMVSMVLVLMGVGPILGNYYYFIIIIMFYYTPIFMLQQRNGWDVNFKFRQSEIVSREGRKQVCFATLILGTFC